MQRRIRTWNMDSITRLKYKAMFNFSSNTLTHYYNHARKKEGNFPAKIDFSDFLRQCKLWVLLILNFYILSSPYPTRVTSSVFSCQIFFKKPKGSKHFLHSCFTSSCASDWLHEHRVTFLEEQSWLDAFSEINCTVPMSCGGKESDWMLITRS